MKVVWGVQAAVFGLVSVFAPMAAMASTDEQLRMLALLKHYLTTSEQMIQLAKHNDSAVYFAVEGIVEIYEQRGTPEKAIPHLKKVLEENADNPTVRTMVHFKLRDLYRDLGFHALAIQELEKVIEENR